MLVDSPGRATNLFVVDGTLRFGACAHSEYTDRVIVPA